MTTQFLIRRDFVEIFPFLQEIRSQADSERTALGFLPEPAYGEAARQRKLILLVAVDGDNTEYAGHLLFGGVFPSLRVRQICIAPKHRRKGQASTLLRSLKSQGEMEGYFSIVANVATDLHSANSFYERNGFSTLRIKAGGTTRNRTINVRTLQLQTPSLISLMGASGHSPVLELVPPKKRDQLTSLYAIDLNVFFDVIKIRARSEDAGVLFGAALRHEIRIAASDEFIRELERKSRDKVNDPALSLAKQIPNLPPQEKSLIQGLIPQVANAVFPERAALSGLKPSDESDVLHLCHAIAAGAAGYIASDSKILAARDELISKFGLDIIGLAEFVELLDLPTTSSSDSSKATKYFRINRPTAEEIESFVKTEKFAPSQFIRGTPTSECERACVSDSDGIIGISLLLPARAIDQPSRSIVYVRQAHAFSSTVADFLISEQVRACSRRSPCNITMLDIADHPITRRMALSHGFRQDQRTTTTLTKAAIGQPITSETWRKTRLAIDRLVGLKLQDSCPKYTKPVVKFTTTQGQKSEVPLFELETLLSPTIFALPERKAVVVPIKTEFANALLGTELQYSFLEVPEAQFLSRRTYFNTVRAARAMIRGSVIAFYESVRSKGRGAIIALGRIVDVTSIPVESIPEFIKRAAVVDDPSTLTSSKRILVTTFDNLLVLPRPVTLKELRQLGCVNRSNFVSATAISPAQLEKIIHAGFPQ